MSYELIVRGTVTSASRAPAHSARDRHSSVVGDFNPDLVASAAAYGSPEPAVLFFFRGQFSA